MFTIGHSTRSWDDFLALLRRHGVRRLVDVRTFPGSRRHPQFGRTAMEHALPAAGIAYEHAPSLGGRRRPRPGAAPTGWRNEGFRGYADHMTTAEFRDGLARLEARASAEPTVVMCSEAVPWRCHRTLLSDALAARGWDVRHIMDDGLRPHTLTSFARIDDGEVRYGPDDGEQLTLADIGD